MEDLVYCDKCGYSMEWLDKCEWCGKTYCEYCGVQGDSCCNDCKECNEEVKNLEEIELMDIYAEEGTKVKYLNQNGYDYEREEANKELVEGEVYTVKYTIVGSWYSTVVLKEFPDKEFNTVMFGAVE